jgi:hypothetical protein
VAAYIVGALTIVDGETMGIVGTQFRLWQGEFITGG